MQTTYTDKKGIERVANEITQSDDSHLNIVREMKKNKIAKSITFIVGRHIFAVNVYENGTIGRELKLA